MNKIREGHVLGVAAVLVLPLAILVPKGTAPLLAIVAVAILVVRRMRARPIAFGAVRILRIAAVFVAYAFLTALWSRTPAHTVYAIPPLIGITAGGFVVLASILNLEDDDRRILSKWLFASGVVGFSFLLFERVTAIATIRWIWDILERPEIPLFHAQMHLNRAMVIAALFVWLWAAVALRLHSFRAGLVTLAVGCAVALSADSTAPVVAIGIGLAVAVVTWIAPRLLPYAFGATLAIGVLAAPFIPGALPNPATEPEKLSSLSNSAIHRLHIWRTTASHIQDRWVFGHGFDTSRSFYGADTKVRFLLRKSADNTPQMADSEPIPLHPHNMVLQVWLELGAIGAVLMLAILIGIVVAIARSGLERVEKSLCFGFFASALLIAVVSFGAWQAWWLSALWLCGALTAGAVLSPSGSRPG